MCLGVVVSGSAFGDWYFGVRHCRVKIDAVDVRLGQVGKLLHDLTNLIRPPVDDVLN